MFSEGLKTYTETVYEGRREYLWKIGVASLIEQQEGESALLLKFLYATMPISDVGEYDFSLYVEYVDHALWLRKNVTWCTDLQEDLFLHYVLYYRINKEKITSCRPFFYQQLKERIVGKTLQEAVLEINYWCAEQATYAASDARTLCPMSVYQSGTGRCGEESTFTVSVLRSMGIAARQVYVPWWAHCDDNHAWVEVYVDGKWHFLGACEPEEVLDRGWFLGASSRAILVHSITFSDYWIDEAMYHSELISKSGSVYFHNSTPIYAKTKRLSVQVIDDKQNPVYMANIHIQVLNMAEYVTLATLSTDRKGMASIALGIGDIHLLVEKNHQIVEMKCSVDQEDNVVICINAQKTDSYVEEILLAPEEYAMNKGTVSKEQKKYGLEKIKRANLLRKEKLDQFFDQEKASKYLEYADILRTSKGNFEEIYSFLDKDDNPIRGEILKNLSLKDLKDAKAFVLETFVEWNVLQPRISDEELSVYPEYIHHVFSVERLQQFKENPQSIWEYISTNIEDLSEEGYESLISTPVNCLKVQQGSLLSRKILFVAICRTIQIESRINPETLSAEFLSETGYQSVSDEKLERVAQGKIILHCYNQEIWNYNQSWTIAQKQVNGFETIHYENLEFENDVLTLNLDAGTYRLLLANRLPNGNQHVVEQIITVGDGEAKEVLLKQHQVKMEELLCNYILEDFDVVNEAGEAIRLSKLTSDSPKIIAFLDVGKEPTEHVLNEMLELQHRISAIDHTVYVIIPNKDSLQNQTLEKVLKSISTIQVLYDDQFMNTEQVARRMFLDPEKMPLLVVTNPEMKGVYGCSGYNVGSVDLMLKILQLSQEHMTN